MRTTLRVLPLELYRFLQSRAEETCYTLPAYVRQVLKRYVRPMEDFPLPLDDWWLL